jgi:hypothetical protein
MIKSKFTPTLAGLVIPAAFLATTTVTAVPASAGFMTEQGTVLENYTVVSVGPNSSIMVNSGPITGNVLLGDGGTSSSSGGGGGQVTGVVDVSGTSNGDNLANIQNKPTIVTVPASVGTDAFSSASAISSADAALPASQTFTGTLMSATTITGNAGSGGNGINVIDFDNIHNAPLTIDGTANDFFVFNVSGQFQTNVAMTLEGGVTANHILWNFTGTSEQVLNTSGGNTLYGTFLATGLGADFQFSSLDLMAGQLIDTGGHIQFVSNSSISNFAPFVPAPPIGRGLPVFLAVGGMLFGARLVDRNRKRRLLAAAIPPAAA